VTGHRVPVVAKELGPHLHVAVFNLGESQVDTGSLGIRLASRELSIHEGGVGLVREVVKPG
jgi:hypothetical protein